jgi:xanthine dehydrogenase YagS FAD-binding subunit
VKRFAYAQAFSVEEAIQVLDGDCRPLAGGTDLIGLMKKGPTAPERVVSLKAISGLQQMDRDGDQWRIGALTTLSELSEQTSGAAGRELRVLSQAALESASPQLRHVATIGGNLMQRPRCWYFRNPLTRCWLKGGDHCFAAVGRNAYHAIFGATTCHMVHPSDPAVALLALNAEVEVTGPDGSRRVGLEDLFAEPQQGAWSETVLDVDELITRVFIPGQPNGARGVYVKVAERAAWDFALVSAAVQISLTDDTVAVASVALGGVAPMPWRAREVEAVLAGKPLTAEIIEEAASASSSGAEPLSENGYKVHLVGGVVREALTRLSQR